MEASDEKQNRPRLLVLSYDSAPIVRVLGPLLRELREHADILVLAQFPSTLRAWRREGLLARSLRSTLGWEHGKLPDSKGVMGSVSEALEQAVLYESTLEPTEASGWAAEAERITARFAELMEAWQPSLVLAWNGHTLPFKPCLAYARSMNVAVRVLERGYFPGSLFLDAEGTNSASSVKAMVNEPLPAESPAPASLIRAFVEEYVPIVEQGTSRSLERVSLQERLGLAADCVLFLMPEQLDHDSNTVLFCDTVSSNLEMVQACVDCLSKRAEKDVYLLFKPHPESEAELSEVAEVLGECGVVVRGVPLPELLGGVDAVITRNSTLGLEALLFGKRVIALGEAIYTGLGMTEDVRTLEALPGALEGVLLRPSLSSLEMGVLERLVGHLHAHHHYFGRPDASGQRSNTFQIRDLSTQLGSEPKGLSVELRALPWAVRLAERLWECRLWTRELRGRFL